MDRARFEAHEFSFKYGYNIPTHVLAQRVAEITQVYTQEASSRVLACICTMIGFDEEKGPQLFRIDPAGQFFSYHAISTGSRESDATNYFEKLVDELPTYDSEGVVRSSLKCLQRVLSADVKGTEVEVAFVDEDMTFRLLSPEEIEEHLNAITEEDT